MYKVLAVFLLLLQHAFAADTFTNKQRAISEHSLLADVKPKQPSRPEHKSDHNTLLLRPTPQSSDLKQQLTSLKNINGLINDLNNLEYFDSPDNEYLNMNIAVRIHESCLENFNNFFNHNRFEELVEETLTTGLICLKNEAKNRINSSQPIEIFNLLNRFYAQLNNLDQPISIHCNVPGVGWKHAVAKGTSKAYTFENLKLSHPAVLINPSAKVRGFAEYVMATRFSDANDIRRSLFHEMIHNLGYSHTQIPDIGYACESCCFSSEEKAIACKLCAGAYNNFTNTNNEYFRDLAVFSLQEDIISARDFFINHHQELQKNQQNLISMALTFQGFHTLIAVPLTKSIAQYKQMDLNSYKILQQHLIQHQLQYKTYDLVEKSMGTELAQIIFDVLVYNRYTSLSQFERLLKQYEILKTQQHNKHQSLKSVFKDMYLFFKTLSRNKKITQKISAKSKVLSENCEKIILLEK